MSRALADHGASDPSVETEPIVVDFCGSEVELHPDESLTFGRTGDLVIDEPARTATLAGDALELTPKGFELLAFMAGRPGEAFSRQDLLREVWDSSSEWQDPATVTVHIRRLRAKIEADVDAPTYLETVWGVGYRFKADA